MNAETSLNKQSIHSECIRLYNEVTQHKITMLDFLRELDALHDPRMDFDVNMELPFDNVGKNN